MRWLDQLSVGKIELRFLWFVVVSFGCFFGLFGGFDPESSAFPERKRDDFVRKIVVKTWWLSAKSRWFGGG